MYEMAGDTYPTTRTLMKGLKVLQLRGPYTNRWLQIIQTNVWYPCIESFHDQGAHFTRDVIVEV